MLAALDRLVNESSRVASHDDPYAGPLRIIGASEKPIRSLEDWRQFAAPAKGDKQWVEGRSAQESARAWLRARTFGAPPALSALFASRTQTAGMRLGLVKPEARIALDDARGNTRNADILAFGTAPGGRTLLTVEAKADESFGPTVDAALADPNLSQRSGLPKRIGRLTGRLFVEGVAFAELRYQLIHGLAATVLEAERRDADQAVFAIHEFHGETTKESLVRRNANDFAKFVRALGADAPPVGRLIPVALPGAALPVFVGRAVTDVP